MGENGEFFFTNESDLNMALDYVLDQFGYGTYGTINRDKLSLYVTKFDRVCDIRDWLDYNNVKYTLVPLT